MADGNQDKLGWHFEGEREGGRDRQTERDRDGKDSTIHNSHWVELTYFLDMSTDQSSIQCQLGRHSCSHGDPTRWENTDRCRDSGYDTGSGSHLNSNQKYGEINA